MLPVKCKILAHRAVTEHIDEDRWDGKKLVRGRMGMDVKGAGTGGDGTEIPSLCRPL